MDTLEIRLTNRYVGTYQHEDEWLVIGSYEITYSEKWIKQEEDGYDSVDAMKVYHHVTVNSDASVEDIGKALQDTFTMAGCHHEYDCCGCRSYYASKPKRISDDSSVWLVEVNSWRNF